MPAEATGTIGRDQPHSLITGGVIPQAKQPTRRRRAVERDYRLAIRIAELPVRHRDSGTSLDDTTVNHSGPRWTSGVSAIVHRLRPIEWGFGVHAGPHGTTESLVIASHHSSRHTVTSATFSNPSRSRIGRENGDAWVTTSRHPTASAASYLARTSAR